MSSAEPFFECETPPTSTEDPGPNGFKVKKAFRFDDSREVFKTSISLEFGGGGDDEEEGEGASGKLELPKGKLNVAHINSNIFNNEPALPSSINVTVLYEALLADAPFITRGNRSFWKKWLNFPQTALMLASSYNIVASCISENGIFQVDKLNEIAPNSSLMASMATGFCEIYFNGNRTERDNYISKLPEIIAYLTTIALANAIPKHNLLYSSVKFREIVLDWTSEIIGGIRQCNLRSGREWFFSSAVEREITIDSDRPYIGVVKGWNLQKHMQGSLRSTYQIECSPLLDIYYKQGGDSPVRGPALSLASVASPLRNSPLKSNAALASSTPLSNKLSLVAQSPTSLLASTSSAAKLDRLTDVATSHLTPSKSASSILSPMKPFPNTSRFLFPDTSSTSDDRKKLSDDASHGSTSSISTVATREAKMAKRFRPRSLKLTLTHPSSRSLVNLLYDGVIPGEGRIRPKKADYMQIRKDLIKVKQSRKVWMDACEKEKRDVREKVESLRESLKIQIKMLESGGGVSQADYYKSMSALHENNGTASNII